MSLNRRTFMKTTAAGAAAAVTGLAARPAHAREPVIIGSGEHTYEVDHAWAKLPEGKAFGYTHGIVHDRDGRIYIANQGPDALMVFEPDGTFVTSWGEHFAPGAHGLTIADEGDREVLYFANTSLSEVVKTTLDGRMIWKRGTPPLPGVYDEEHRYSPTETAVSPDGMLYVTDGYGQDYVHLYRPDGTYVRSFGGRGDEPHHLRNAHGITIDPRGAEPMVQVSDRANVRVVNFNLDGEYAGEVIGKDALRFPCSTAHHGALLYVPDLFARVSIFDESNRKVIDLGDYVDGADLTTWDQIRADIPDYPNIPHDRRIAGKFSSPHGLMVDPDGNIFVVEWIEDGRVTKLTKQG